MGMVKILNTVAVTLLIAVAAVMPAAFIGRYVPGFLDPGIKQIAVAGWIAALGSWFLARMVMRKEQEAVQESAKHTSGGGMLIGVVFLFVAVGIAVVLHFYGTSLLP